MKKTRYTDDQMVRILREADKTPVAQVAKRHGVSEATIYAWRKRFGELDVSDVRHLSVARSTLDYRSILEKKDAPVLVAMRRLARLYPRFGYPSIAILLRREGHPMSFDRAFRLWKQAELQVPRKHKRRRPAASRPRPLPPKRQNAVWACDFMFDRCANGRTLKCLTVVDEYTRKCLAIDVAARIRSARAIDQLAQLIIVYGVPR